MPWCSPIQKGFGQYKELDSILVFFRFCSFLQKLTHIWRLLHSFRRTFFFFLAFKLVHIFHIMQKLKWIIIFQWSWLKGLISTFILILMSSFYIPEPFTKLHHPSFEWKYQMVPDVGGTLIESFPIPDSSWVENN